MEYKNPLTILIISIVLVLLGATFYFVLQQGLLPSGAQKVEPGSRTVFSEPVGQEEKDIIPPPLPEEAEPKEEAAPVSSEIEEVIVPSPPPPQKSVPAEAPLVIPEEPIEPQPKEYTIAVESDGFHPDFITINVGDTVRWVNNDTGLHWPSADPHPTHSDLFEFDPLADLLPGEFYLYTFTEAGAIGYHDHTAAVEDDEATITGTIRVLPRE